MVWSKEKTVACKPDGCIRPDPNDTGTQSNFVHTVQEYAEAKPMPVSIRQVVLQQQKFKTLLEAIRSKVDKLDMLYVNIITLVSNRFLLERLTQDFFIGTWGAKMLHMDQHGVSEKNSNLTK